MSFLDRVARDLPPQLKDNPFFDFAQDRAYVPAWGKVMPKDADPAILHIMMRAVHEIDGIKASKSRPSFGNTIGKLEDITNALSYFSRVFNILDLRNDRKKFHLSSTNMHHLVGLVYQDLFQDEALYKRVSYVYKNRKKLKLTDAQKLVCESYYRSFKDEGAGLSRTKRIVMDQFDRRITELEKNIQHHMQDHKPAHYLYVDDVRSLRGLPATIIKKAWERAMKAGHPAAYILKIDNHSYQVLNGKIENRALREKIWGIYRQRTHEDTHNIGDQIVELVTLKDQRAKLLGFKSSAEYEAQYQMVGDVKAAKKFLGKIEKAATPVASAEYKALTQFARKKDGIRSLKPWDILYYTEALEREVVGFSDDDLKPYFEMDNVLDGLFKHFKKLYGITFTQNTDHPVHHKDVKAYDVHDTKTGAFKGVVFMDLCARPEKPETWGYDYTILPHASFDDVDQKVLNCVVTNIERPAKGKPVLLTHEDILTLLHELGHATHELLNTSKYPIYSSLDSETDFMEVLSTIMENWGYEEEFLRSFAKHHKTKRPIPEDMIAAIKQKRTFMSGTRTIKDVIEAKLDLAWHHIAPEKIKSLPVFEALFLEKQGIKKAEQIAISLGFSHSFGGGYDGKYYSYVRAAMMEADLYSAFQSAANPYHKETAKKLRRMAEAGSSDAGVNLFEEMMGRGERSHAYLKRQGFLKSSFEKAAKATCKKKPNRKHGKKDRSDARTQKRTDKPAL